MGLRDLGLEPGPNWAEAGLLTAPWLFGMLGAWAKAQRTGASCFWVGVRIRGTLGDIDPLNKVPFKRARSRVQKGPLQGVSLMLPRIGAMEWALTSSMEA